MTTTTERSSLIADLDRTLDMIHKITTIIQADISNPIYPQTTRDAIGLAYRYLSDTAHSLAREIENTTY
jgi:hypothetical protein